MMRTALNLAVLLLAVITPVFAQSNGPTLYVSVLETRGYVVGSDNAASGLYRYDGDAAWTHLGWSNTRNFGIDIEPSNPERIYLACGNGVIRSLDGGQNWRVLTGWQITEVLDVAIDRRDPEKGFIATAHGIWRTLDGGDSWIEANDGIQRPRESFTQAIEVDAQDSERLLAGTEVGMFLSTDAGKSWRAVGPRNVAIRDLRQSAAAPDVWIAGTEDRGLIRSEDDGATWAVAGGGIADLALFAVAIDPNDPQRMAAAGFESAVFFSTDGGRQWDQSAADLPVTAVHALQFDPVDSGKLWAGTVGGGVFSTVDAGKSWQNAGLEGAVIYDMIFIDQTP
jgi:photosystem II stability/assembly factor-like uncharacterized protein